VETPATIYDLVSTKPVVEAVAVASEKPAETGHSASIIEAVATVSAAEHTEHAVVIDAVVASVETVTEAFTMAEVTMAETHQDVKEVTGEIVADASETAAASEPAVMVVKTVTARSAVASAITAPTHVSAPVQTSARETPAVVSARAETAQPEPSMPAEETTPAPTVETPAQPVAEVVAPTRTTGAPARAAEAPAVVATETPVVVTEAPVVVIETPAMQDVHATFKTAPAKAAPIKPSTPEAVIAAEPQIVRETPAPAPTVTITPPATTAHHDTPAVVNASEEGITITLEETSRPAVRRERTKPTPAHFTADQAPAPAPTMAREAPVAAVSETPAPTITHDAPVQTDLSQIRLENTLNSPPSNRAPELATHIPKFANHTPELTTTPESINPTDLSHPTADTDDEFTITFDAAERTATRRPARRAHTTTGARV
jgi:hypothetical protein